VTKHWLSYFKLSTFNKIVFLSTKTNQSKILNYNSNIYLYIFDMTMKKLVV